MKIKKESSPPPISTPKPPTPHPAPKKPAPASSTVAGASIEGETERDINTLKEWLKHILYRPSDVKLFIKFYRRHSIGVVTTIGLVLFFFIVVLPLYYSYLFSSSETAFAEKRYQDSINSISRYLEHDSSNTEAYLLLVKNYIYSDKLEETKKALAQAETHSNNTEDDLEVAYYNAVLKLLLNPKAPNLYIEKSLNLAPTHIPTLFVQSLDRVIKRDWSAAQSSLNDIAQALEDNDDDDDIIEKVGFITGYFFKHNLLPFISTTPPLSFPSGTKDIPLAQALGFEIGYSGFQNLYYMPYDQAFLSTMRVSEIFDLILVVTYAAEEKNKKGKIVLIKNRHENSIWAKYFLAYISIKEKNYKKAATLYKNIIGTQPSSDSLLMLANAKWALQKGKVTDDIIKLFKQSYDADNDNVPAINNLAFINIYAGKENLAMEILTNVKGSIQKNKYATQNLALLNLASSSPDEAREKIYSLLENNPDSILLRNAILLLENKKGDYPSAIEHANAIKELLPDSSHIYLKIADMYNKTGDYLLQLLELEDGHNKYPQNKELLAELALGYTYRLHENLGKVLPTAIESIGDDYRVLLAQALLSEGESAVDFFNQSIEKAPRNKKADASYLLGRFYLKNDNVRKALKIVSLTDTYDKQQKNNFFALKLRVKTLTQGISISTLKEEASKIDMETSSVLAIIDVAWALLHLMQTEQAISILEVLQEKQQRSSEALDTLLFAYQQKGDVVNAEATKIKILAVEKNSSDIKQSLTRKNGLWDLFVSSSSLDKLLTDINRAVSNKQYVSAISLYTKLLKRENLKLKSLAASYQNRGALYINIKKYQEAAADFAKALSLKDLKDSQKLNVHYNYAYSLLQIKDYASAVTQIKKALNLKPKNEIKFLSLLGLAYSGLNDITAAINTYEELIRLTPGTPRYYLILASIQRKTGKLEDAIKILSLALNFHKDNPKIHFKLAEYYTAAGNLEKARNHLKLYNQIK